MTYANNKLYENHQSNSVKYEEYKSRIQQLEQDVTENEDEYSYAYRLYEDAIFRIKQLENALSSTIDDTNKGGKEVGGK
jgi:septation ring formation regulator EzrA